ncbi:sigma-54-dependent Fis family transcriptional regulator, partial [Pseudomonas sp. SIMBA_059]
ACAVEVVLADDALQALLVYRWPGNLRQLRQVLRYACAVSEGGQVQLQDLPQEVRGDAVVSAESGVSCPARQLLLDALIR